MSDLTILRDKKPEIADFIVRWRMRHQRSFHLTEDTEQANFYEAMVEIARHIAGSSTSVDITLAVSNEGVDGLHLSVRPKS